MQRAQVKNALLILVSLAVGYICLQMAAPFLIAIAWAAVLAIIINPMYRRLVARLSSRNLAAALACTAAVLVVVLPLVGIAIAVTRSVIELIHLPQAADGSTTSISDWLASEADVVTRWLNDRFGFDVSGVNVSALVAQVANALLAQSQRLVGGVAGFFFNLVVVIFSLFFFLRDQDQVLLVVRDFVPLSNTNTSAVFRRVHDVIRASVIGGGAVAVTQGLMAGIGFWVLGIPSPLLWGVATLFFSFIPLVGAAGVWVPAALVLLVKGSWVKALILALYGTLGISLVDNVLRPKLIGDATKLHTLMIFFAILGGLQVFGFLGLVMGPVVLAVGLALVEIFRREILETEEAKRVTHELDEGAG